MCALCLSPDLLAADSTQPTNNPARIQAAAAARARQTYLDFRTRYHADTNNNEVASQFARACFNLASLPTNNTQRAKIAEEGIAVSRQVTSRATNLVQGHYYLGMNLGQLADTKRNLSALKLVKEMEREFEAARKADELFDYAGPDRNLGLLYLQAPTLFSIGDRAKAREHLRRAVELAPDFPANRLEMIEACLKWGERKDALQELKALEEAWLEARRKFAGEAWAADWVEWDRRFEAARRKLGQTNKTPAAPRR